MPDTVQHEGQSFPVRPEIAAKAHVSEARYREMHERAARDPDGFWAGQSRRTAWMKPPYSAPSARTTFARWPQAARILFRGALASHSAASHAGKVFAG